MRKKQEIASAEEKFFDLVWFQRHLSIKDSVIEEYLNSNNPVKIEIAKGVLEAAEKIKEKYKDDPDLNPCNNFEWGMINGKLSALRWVLGDEWDFLDT